MMFRKIRDLVAEALGYHKPCKAKKVSKYMPHQGAKECARRVRQMNRWLNF
jgi:hypothetical protein